MGSLLKLITGGVFGAVEKGIDYFMARQQAKHEAKMAAVSNVAVWEQKMAEASGTSWKDEYWTVILSIPLILVFFPGFVEPIKAGFQVLDQEVPDWYKAGVGAAIASAFAIKKLSDVFVHHSRKKKSNAQ